MGKQNVPEIRFENDVPWKRNRFGELYRKSDERNNGQFGWNKTISIATMTWNETGNGAADSSLASYKVLRTGDIAFEGHTNKEFQFGRFVLNDIGDGITSSIFTILRPTTNQNIIFWKYLIHDEAVMRRKLVYSTKSGIMMNGLVVDDFMKQTIRFPSLPVQREIADLFSSLDRKLAAEQKKLAALKMAKHALFVKIFPREGETVPEIRFEGFSHPWEQREAVDIADYSKGNGYSKSDLTENGTPIILYGRLYTKYQFAIDEVDTFATPKDGSIYSQGNEVIIPASGETAEDIARASAVEKSGILLGGDLNILRPFNFINPLFLALTISNGEPQKDLAKKAQGKSVVHIHNSDIQEVTVSFPTRAEQDRIVAVFRSLDNLITLHQGKLERI